MQSTRELTQSECDIAVMRLSDKIVKVLGRMTRIYGVPRGGLCVAYLCLRHSQTFGLARTPEEADVIVDDIVASGNTRSRYQAMCPGIPFLALADFLVIQKAQGQWLVFPWEKQDTNGDTSGDDIVVRLLEYIGEDPNREGLKETPARVLKAWKEMTVGYSQEPSKILVKDFEVTQYDQIVACPFVEFYSTCEHHLLPFFGMVHIAYLPSKTNPRVVGLSKMARLVDCFSRRLQIQERMTVQIADAMDSFLNPQGVAVVVQAKHLCMACRGVQKHKAVMVTSSMRGVFREEGPARSEFFRLVDLAAHSQ